MQNHMLQLQGMLANISFFRLGLSWYNRTRVSTTYAIQTITLWTLGLAWTAWLSKTKPRLSSDEELATLSLFYETCKVTQRYIFKKIKIIISYNYLICIIYRNNIINVLFLRPLKAEDDIMCAWEQHVHGKVSLTMHFYDLWIKMLL